MRHIRKQLSLRGVNIFASFDEDRPILKYKSMLPVVSKILAERGYDIINKYEKVIIISTQLRFEDLNINAELLIFTTDNSILYIKEKINKILDEL